MKLIADWQLHLRCEVAGSIPVRDEPSMSICSNRDGGDEDASDKG